MRRSREATARTRRSAVEAAAQLFRERGIASVSVGDVMASVGMTAGGFYRHFENKEALAAEACAAGFEDSGLANAQSLETLLHRYLSKAHRDAPAVGCPLPALASDMARQPAAVRSAFTEGVSEALERLCELAPRADSRKRLALMAGMVGAVALARAVDDEELSAAMLRETRRFWMEALS